MTGRERAKKDTYKGKDGKHEGKQGQWTGRKRDRKNLKKGERMRGREEKGRYDGKD